MKKIFLLSAALILSLLPLAAQSVILTSPNGGEDWTLGTPQVITWTNNGLSGTVKLFLDKGGVTQVIASNIPVGDLQCPWTAGQTQGGTAVAGSDYRVNIRVDDPHLGPFYDRSNSSFTLSGTPPVQPSLTLISPNGNENWAQRSNQIISLSSYNLPVPAGLRLLLLKDDQVLGTIRDLNAGDGERTINWKVGEYRGGMAPAASGYKIRVERKSGQYSDDSDNPFTIAPPSLTFAPIRPVKVTAIAFPKKPDLVVCLLWRSETPLILQYKWITVRVKNVGEGDAPASTLRVYVKKNGVHYIPVPALAHGAKFEWEEKFRWGTCGHKAIRAQADYYGQVTESNEGNNMLEKKLMVNCGTTSYDVEMNICSDQN
jgi:hypothetical protein